MNDLTSRETLLEAIKARILEKDEKIDAYDTCDDFSWRGPCEENGGTA